ncbi:unnamed protein product [Linum trigynum]|uniref:Uncharacterized protein n=1 Tax=Linum trigynum TaxID=586398 RepID=A0AAV2EW76_9ROSI
MTTLDDNDAYSQPPFSRPPAIFRRAPGGAIAAVVEHVAAQRKNQTHRSINCGGENSDLVAETQSETCLKNMRIFFWGDSNNVDTIKNLLELLVVEFQRRLWWG